MLQGADDGVPIVVRRNDRADELMLHRDYRHRVVVEIPFRAPTPNGLRAREEAQPINAIEDLVTAALERERASLLALVVNGGGKTALVYYTRAPEIVAAAVRDAEARVPAYRIQHRVDDDPAWEFYRAFLGNSRSG
jgi:hypothetical protein